MEATEKRQVETELLKIGLPGLREKFEAGGDTALAQIVAGCINSWNGYPNRYGEYVDKHKFFRDLLAECDPEYRHQMYDAIKSHLHFEPKSFQEYETMIAERVGKLVSGGAMRVEGRSPHPIEVGGKKFLEADPELATHAVALLKCQRCRKTKQFLGETPADAMTKARKAGWQRIGRETCPKCVPIVNAKMKVN